MDDWLVPVLGLNRADSCSNDTVFPDQSEEEIQKLGAETILFVLFLLSSLSLEVSATRGCIFFFFFFTMTQCWAEERL